MHPTVKDLLRFSALQPDEWQERSLENRCKTHDYSLESIASNGEDGVVLWNNLGQPVEITEQDRLAVIALLFAEDITWGKIQALARGMAANVDLDTLRELNSILSLFLLMAPPTQYMIPRWDEEDALNRVPCLIWTTDHDLRLASLAGGVVTEYPKKSIDYVGHPLSELIEGTNNPEAIAAHEKALRGDDITHFEGLGIFTGVPYIAHVRPIVGRNGQIHGTAGFAFRVGLEVHEKEKKCA